MAREKKEYKVTVSYCENTPEEEARLEAEITAAIFRAKMIAMKRQEEKAAVNT